MSRESATADIPSHKKQNRPDVRPCGFKLREQDSNLQPCGYGIIRIFRLGPDYIIIPGN